MLYLFFVAIGSLSTLKMATREGTMLYWKNLLFGTDYSQ